MTPLLDFENALAELAPGYGKPSTLGSIQTLAELYTALEPQSDGSPTSEQVRSETMTPTDTADGQ